MVTPTSFFLTPLGFFLGLAGFSCEQMFFKHLKQMFFKHLKQMFFKHLVIQAFFFKSDQVDGLG
jgi:hypothetical protein